MLAGFCPLDCPPHCGDGECQAQESAESCIWDCGCLTACKADWECGEDPAGCAEHCGVCPEGIDCNNRKCCIPDCQGKSCGEDGCGSICGYCQPGWTCSDGWCVEPDCIPDCEGKACGPDGCGAQCGDCDDSISCTEDICFEEEGVCYSAIFPYFCLIDGECMLSGALNPANGCEICLPESNELAQSWLDLPDGFGCASVGTCVDGACCDPEVNCADAECGSDGCGGLCGQCPVGWACIGGACVEGVCEGCADKECGVDNCGTVCGDCFVIPECGVGECVFDVCIYDITKHWCFIDGSCVTNGAAKGSEGDDACLDCNYLESQLDWSPAAYKTPCPPLGPGPQPAGDHICYQGSCCLHGENCLGKECGDDGCGGSCGACGDDELCIDDMCVECWDGNDVDWDGCNTGDIVEFRVNTITEGNQGWPRVAARSGGRFAVAWHGFDGLGDADVFVRFFGADGLASEAESQVNETDLGQQATPDIAALDNDRLVVVWAGEVAGGNGSNNVVFRLFEGGAPASSEIVAAKPTTAEGLTGPAVAALPGGGFALAWATEFVGPTSQDVVIQRFLADGTPATAQAAVISDETLFAQHAPALAVLPDGTLAAAWQGQSAADGPMELWARVFAPDGTPLTGDLEVNPFNQGDEVAPGLDGCGDEGFVLCWQDDIADADGAGALGRGMDAQGQFLSAPYLVTGWTQGNQFGAACACRPDTEFAAATPGDSDLETGVHLQRFDNMGDPTPIGSYRNLAGFDNLFGKWQVDVATLEQNNLVAVWDSALDPTGTDIYAMRLDDEGQPCALQSCFTGIPCPGGCPAPDLCTNPGDCQAGQCSPGGPVDCDDGDPCTSDSCDPGLGCEHTAVGDGVPCDDGDPCTAADFCLDGGCQSMGEPDCDDGEFCTDDSCQQWVGCVSVFNTTPCWDDNACTENDHCIQGICTGLPLDCADCTSCTADSCEEQGGCVSNALGEGSPCDSGLGQCAGGVCVHDVDTCIDEDPGDPWDGCDAGQIVEFQVNSGFPPPLSTEPHVIAFPGGEFAAFWHGFTLDDTDGVIARAYDSSGAALMGQKTVNSYPAGVQQRPRGAVLGADYYVLVWDGPGDNDGDGVYGALLDLTGNLLSANFPVNTVTAGVQQRAFPLALADGGFLVAWQSQGQDGDQYGIYAQRFDGQGDKVAGEFKLNAGTGGSQIRPALAATPGNAFIAAWQSDGPGGDGDGDGIIAGAFDYFGTQLVAETLMNSYTDDDQTMPAVLGFADASAIFIWQSDKQDGSFEGIFAQQYDAAGQLDGGEFRVNCHQQYGQKAPDAAAFSDNGFVVVWEGIGPWAGGSNIHGQLYDAAGSRIDSAFQPNTYVNANGGYSRGDPKVAVFPEDDSFIVVWTSTHQGTQNGWYIFAQRYTREGAKIYH